MALSTFCKDVKLLQLYDMLFANGIAEFSDIPIDFDIDYYRNQLKPLQKKIYIEKFIPALDQYRAQAQGGAVDAGENLTAIAQPAREQDRVGDVEATTSPPHKHVKSSLNTKSLNSISFATLLKMPKLIEQFEKHDIEDEEDLKIAGVVSGKILQEFRKELPQSERAAAAVDYLEDVCKRLSPEWEASDIELRKLLEYELAAIEKLNEWIASGKVVTAEEAKALLAKGNHATEIKAVTAEAKAKMQLAKDNHRVKAMEIKKLLSVERNGCRTNEKLYKSLPKRRKGRSRIQFGSNVKIFQYWNDGDFISRCTADVRESELKRWMSTNFPSTKRIMDKST